MPDKQVDLQSAADELDVHYQTAYRWVRTGKLPAELVAGRYLVARRDIEALSSQRTTPRSPTPPTAKRMARAATDYGKGRITPFTPTGAVEVRAAGTAFLDMRNRLERQTQSRTMMLSGVSHDLRTPLTRMRLGLSMIDAEDAEPLLRDVDDMERLLDAFLDFARSDAADSRELSVPADIVRAVLADAERMGQPVTAAKLEGADAPVSLRPMAIRRAMDNLVGNALRYGSRAQIGVSVTDRAVRFWVEDDGPGIPPEQYEDALSPFVRLDPSRNQDQGSGVGLGLSIVADIARTHGGVLRLGRSEALGGLLAELVLAR